MRSAELSPHTGRIEAAATMPALDAKALARLDQINPPVSLPKVTATTSEATTDRPPIDALVLFAEARDEMQAGRRASAIPLLERAIAIDPDSYDLHITLAKAYLGAQTWEARSIEHLRKAEEIDADHADLQTSLGRQLLAKGDRDEGLRHLRLAMKTEDYSTDEGDAAVAEWFLGNVLQSEGYLTAALDLFIRLELRLGRPNSAVRAEPELFFVARRPEQLVGRIADLHEQLGHYGEAAAVYGAIVDAHPESFDFLGKYVRALIRAGRPDEAIRTAGEQVVRTSAGHDSIALLREACRLCGREGAAARELARLHRERPDDRMLLYAVVDQLDADGRDADAMKLLSDAESRNPSDFELFRRSISLEQQMSSDTAESARRVIAWSAKNPNSVHRLEAIWTELSRPGAPGRLRLAALQRVEPGPADKDNPAWQAAKDYWVYRTASASDRAVVARAALKHAIDIGSTTPPPPPTPFAPAYRDQLEEIWQRSDLSSAGQRAAAQQLEARADRLGDKALAAEIRGQVSFREKQYADAVASFKESAGLGGRSPELEYARTLAERLSGDDATYEQSLWKIVSDWPHFEPAYRAIIDFNAVSAPNKIEKVVSDWLAAEPDSIDGRIEQVIATYRSGRAKVAEKLLNDLFDDRGASDSRVLAVMEQFYAQSDRTGEFEKKLLDRQKSDPANLAVAGRLVEIYDGSNRKQEALRVADVSRAAVADDADALYAVTHLYMRAGFTAQSEAALRDVLRLDPAHAPAANDLGYNLGDRGDNLDEAERLVRAATTADPDNAAYLDSLGWVLYKRAKFADAADALKRAVTLDGEKADPVVRNHLGDALYRIGDADGAAAQWKLASDRLAAMKPERLSAREDLVTLKADLLQKTSQLKKNLFPKLAPAVNDPVPATSHAEKSE